MIYLVVILFLLSVISKYFCDRIRFKGNFESDWMIGAGKYVWYKRTWLTKHIFSFVSDGWHFFDAARVFSLCMVIALYFDKIYLAIPLYIIHGLIFESLYRIK